jgi:hypothetical protein
MLFTFGGRMQIEILYELRATRHRGVAGGLGGDPSRYTVRWHDPYNAERTPRRKTFGVDPLLDSWAPVELDLLPHKKKW